MSRVSTIRNGHGEGTTRRHAFSSALTVHPRSAATRRAPASGYSGRRTWSGRRRPVAVRDPSWSLRASGPGVDGDADVALLDLGVRRLAPFEEGVAADGNHDAHAQRPGVATMTALTRSRG